MKVTFHRAMCLAAIGLTATAYAGDTMPLTLPPPPKPVPQQPLPLNAQVTPNGVYVPVTKSGNFGVSVEGLRNPQPGEKGGAVSLTVKTK
jgi:hypothetical protein